MLTIMQTGVREVNGTLNGDAIGIEREFVDANTSILMVANLTQWPLKGKLYNVVYASQCKLNETLQKK